MTDRNDEEMENLFKRRRELRNKQGEQSRVELEKVEEAMANKFAEENINKINEEIAGIDSQVGGKSSGSLWILRKKLSTEGILKKFLHQ